MTNARLVILFHSVFKLTLLQKFVLAASDNEVHFLYHFKVNTGRKIVICSRGGVFDKKSNNSVLLLLKIIELMT